MWLLLMLLAFLFNGCGVFGLRILAGMGLKAKDALHIACAIAGACTYFVTTDDDVLKRRQDVHDITVIDPTAFVREMNL